ncbi:MAG: FAD-dependent oxidoreductase [Bryobacterales bacterium]|nr:FAD-dependent oxidoreductase [Bryobacterales bacterium]
MDLKVFWKLIQQALERVAVIGAGIVGASIAWRLAQCGFSVTVYDAGAFAGEASAAGAGMLSPGGEANQLADWARDTVEARAMYPDFVAELQDESEHRIDFRACGAIDLALDSTDWDALQRRRTVQEALGIQVEGISRAEVRRLAPALSTAVTRGEFSALWFANDAVVNPRDVTRALSLLLPRAGVAIREHCPVAACTWQGNHFEVRSATAGPLSEADAVVMAAGAWSSTIDFTQESLTGMPGLPLPRKSVPIRGHLIQCEQPPGTLGPIVRHRHLYVFQRRSGSMVAGSNEELVGFDRTPNLEAVNQIHGHTEQLLPGLFPPLSDTHWLGFRPGIGGSGPEVRQFGRLPLWLAYGHYRNGILLAPHTAQRIALYIKRFAAGTRPPNEPPVTPEDM